MTQPTRPPRPRWLSIPVAIVLLAAAMLIPAATSVAAEDPTDMVLEWNINAVNAIQNQPGATPPGLAQVPPLAPISLAMVHGAIYDAVNAIDGSREPYLLDIHAQPSASQAAAAATAAHHVLVGLVPVTTPPSPIVASLDALYKTSLDKIPGGQPKSDGIVVGAAAAAVMLADRLGDGRTGTRMFPVGTEKGEWRTVPPLSNNVFSWVGEVRPFSLRKPDQFRVDAPPALRSRQYTREFNEVKALGAKFNSSRTTDQDALASFAAQNPFGPVNQAFRDLSTGYGLSTAEQARLFAMTSLSSADALINCFNQKHRYLFWRPQTAIQEAANDGNPDTDPDPNWVSLFSTPGYPDMPSGYNCFAASTMHAGKAFFGTDRVAFSLVTPVSTRSYTRFTDYVDDAIDGRILTGFHFRSADEQGAWLGEQTAEWVARHEFERDR